MKDFPHRSQVVILLSVGFICGTSLMSWFTVEAHVLYFIAGMSGFGLLLGFHRTTAIWLSIIFACGFAAGVWRTDSSLQVIASQPMLETVINHPARVVSVPSLSERFQSAHVELTGESENETVRVLVRFPKYDEVTYGTYMNLTCGEVSVPEPFDDFDYPMFLAMKGVGYICEKPQYEIFQGPGNLLTTIASLRRSLESNIAHLISAPASALANGLLFGGDDRLSQELQDAFARTGMTHIVAVSGYNVSVIVLAVTAVAIYSGLWRRSASLVALLCVVFFIAMIGFPSSGVRAGIMGSLVLIAVVYGRATHAVSAVAFSAAMMLLYNPLQLRYDVGFQLSFLAVLGILFFYPLFARYIVREHKAFTMTEIIFLTISAQILVVPIIMIYFHTVSVTSLVANALVLPVLPFTMLFTFLTAVASIFSFLVAMPFAWVAQWLLEYEIFIITFFSDVSWSSYSIEHISLPLVFLYYAAMCAIMYYYSSHQHDSH